MYANYPNSRMKSINIAKTSSVGATCEGGACRLQNVFVAEARYYYE